MKGAFRTAGAILRRIAAPALAMIVGLIAWRAGGGAESAAAPPRPAAASPSAQEPDAASSPKASSPVPPGVHDSTEAYEVAIRLLDLMKEARINVSNSALTQHVLGAHWRKMKPPFVAPAGAAAPYVTSIALRTSATEVQWSMAQGPGKAWTPDARVWNMNEGSFDQREAIAAAVPSSFTFKVTVPRGGRLTFAEGTVNATHDATAFVVTVVDPRGVAREVYRHRLPSSASRRWTEGRCDLSRFAGQTVDLRLSTEVLPSPPPRVDVARAGGVPDGGAGAADVPVVPEAAVALWANPTLQARTIPRLPYNVLWIVVDALRPDVLASFHDDAEDAAKRAAAHPPLEALLPKVPGLMPVLDELAKKAVRFTHAYSGGSWTRPGTLSMLAGARSTELGLPTLPWVLPQGSAARFYASDPPLLPLILRQKGAVTRAFVNNYFMVGYAPVGVEMGFERSADHRYRTRDTLEVTSDATAWLRENKDTRFFVFVNYNSPHEPYEPPPRYLERVPPPPAGPKDKITRLYMAEAAKDDEAIGVLLRTLDETGTRDRTIIVVTADHGETLSSAHAGTSGLDRMQVRYHHAVSNYEETAKVPILIALPGTLPEDVAVTARVRNIDIAPTILELMGAEPHPRMSGRSLVSLARGQKEPEERVVVTEGRGTRAVTYGRYRLLVREGAARTTYVADKAITANEELYDLVDDPGERRDLAPAKPALVEEMRARLGAALKNAPVAGSAAATAGSPEAGHPPTLHLRFVGGGKTRRVSGVLVVGDARTKATSLDVQPALVGRDAFKIGPDGKVELALTTSPSDVVGIDLMIEPAGVPVSWEFFLDDQPWPEESVFGGPFGLLSPVLRKGVTTDEARLAAHAFALPPIDPRRDVGIFVVRERRGAEEPHETDGEGAAEMARLLREWGYAHGSGGGK